MHPFFRVLVAALAARHALALSSTGHTPTGTPIFDLPAGTMLQQSGSDMHAIAANGSIIHGFENAVPTRTSSTRSQSPVTRQAGATVAMTSALATWDSDDGIEFFNTTIVVPPEPATFDSQLMLFGAGVVDPDITGAPQGIFSVGLQYGGASFMQGLAGYEGGSFWTPLMILEFVPDPTLVRISLFSSPSTTPVVLNSGDILSVSFSGSSEAVGNLTYHLYTASVPNRPDLSDATVAWQTPVNAVTMRAVEYGVVSGSDYPDESLVFGNVTLELDSGFPALDWSVPDGVDPATSIEIELQDANSDGQKGQVVFVFPDSD
ncbi:hypothetical protein HMN09_01320200 [Mycena chlorophos]|uniref:Acid protease n=1 Tax=Mycena chlorophos TaxID=658473 RepID=A0A8H6RZ81_MYCCL|nr:hypothetical protein HMN09_01320200 [Mycena chlorophos]